MVNRIIVGLGIIFCLSLAVTAIAQNKVGACQGIDLHWIQKHAPVPSAKIVFQKEVEGLCEMILDIGGEMVPLYAGREFLIAGEMFVNKRQVSQQSIMTLQSERDSEMKKRFAEIKPRLEQNVAFQYKPAIKGKKSLYMFTDPLCPYCNKAGNELKTVADQSGITIKAIIFNVHGDPGRENAVAAVCRKYDFEQYLRSDWKSQSKGKEDDCESGRQLYDQSMQIGRDMGIRGVPFFVTEDGEIIRGADLDAIKKALES